MTWGRQVRIRRCSVVFVEPAERLVFDLDSLLLGGSGARVERQWLAWAPHLDEPVAVDEDAVRVLGRISALRSTSRGDLDLRGAESTALDGLLACGLVLCVDGGDNPQSAADARIRDTFWSPHAALAHYASRWGGIDASLDALPPGFETMDDLVAQLGAPPTTFGERADADRRIELAQQPGTELDALLLRRATCRNFSEAPLALPAVERMLHRVVGAQAVVDAGEGSTIAKKNSPSGGGLHPLEAYLLVQRVDGLAPGLYHYHAGNHALEHLPLSEGRSIRTLCDTAVAGQKYFGAAPLLLVFTARFRRSFWKYRSHAKAYRSILIELGHMSQNLYLSATELGLGAFVTAAINERDIERFLALDALEESPLAVCGVGHRSSCRETVELDPLNKVWPAAAEGASR